MCNGIWSVSSGCWIEPFGFRMPGGEGRQFSSVRISVFTQLYVSIRNSASVKSGSIQEDWGPAAVKWLWCCDLIIYFADSGVILNCKVANERKVVGIIFNILSISFPRLQRSFGRIKQVWWNECIADAQSFQACILQLCCWGPRSLWKVTGLITIVDFHEHMAEASGSIVSSPRKHLGMLFDPWTQSQCYFKEGNRLNLRGSLYTAPIDSVQTMELKRFHLAFSFFSSNSRMALFAVFIYFHD